MCFLLLETRWCSGERAPWRRVSSTVYSSHVGSSASSFKHAQTLCCCLLQARTADSVGCGPGAEGLCVLEAVNNTLALVVAHPAGSLCISSDGVGQRCV